MIHKLKKLSNSLKYKRKYAGNTIADSAEVSDSQMASQNQIQRESSLVGSNLGQSNRIERGASIENSDISSHSSFGGYSKICKSRFSDYCTIMRKAKVSNSNLSKCSAIGIGSEIINVNFNGYGYIGDKSIIHNTEIGKFCSLGRQLICGLGTHPTDFASTSPIFYSTSGSAYYPQFSNRTVYEETHPIKIGNDVWIGARVTIIDGVTITDGSVIAAGAVVTKDTEPYGIYAGIPAKKIKSRFDETISKALLESKWWELAESDLKELQPYFASSDIKQLLVKIREFNSITKR